MCISCNDLSDALSSITVSDPVFIFLFLFLFMCLCRLGGQLGTGREEPEGGADRSPQLEQRGWNRSRRQQPRTLKLVDPQQSDYTLYPLPLELHKIGR